MAHVTPRDFPSLQMQAKAFGRRRGTGALGDMSDGPSVPAWWRTWLGCAAMVLAIAGCSGESEPPVESPVRPAKLLVVSPADNVRTVSLPAVIDAAATAELAFQVSGLVAAIAVREGESVAAGTEIARLDQRDLKTELTTAQANHHAAEVEFQRAERLIVENAISRAVHEQRQTQLEVAQAALEAARNRLDDSVLRSPFAGVIAALHVEAHQNIAPQQVVVTVQSIGVAEAVVQVPAALVANSRRIEPLETVVVLDAVPAKPVPATFHSIVTRADPVAQTFEVRVSFTPPPELRILPGMTGTVRSKLVIAGNGVAQIVVPIEAILSEADARYVWVVDVDSMTVSKRPVTLGDGVGETLPVLAGLAVGETIVAAGVSYLHEGMRIRRYEP